MNVFKTLYNRTRGISSRRDWTNTYNKLSTQRSRPSRTGQLFSVFEK